MNITLRYFASLREALGDSESLTIAEGSTLVALRDALCTRSQRHAEVLARGRAVRAALNQRLAGDDAVVPAAPKWAFFPPSRAVMAPCGGRKR